MTNQHPEGPRPPSYSEAQLRDALRGSSGWAPAGGALDPEALIGRARSQRARRRGSVLAAGLVAAVVAVSVGVVRTGDDAGGMTSASQFERGDADGGAGGNAAPGAAPSAPAAPPGSSAGGAADTQLPFTDGPGPGEPYASREPISGSPCPPARTDPLDAPAGPGSTGPLLGFAPEQAWACVYLADGSAVATELTAGQAVAAVALLSTGTAPAAEQPCTSEFGPAVRLILTGSGRATTIDAESYGCGLVTNGTASRLAKAQVIALLGQLDNSLRPLG